MGLALARSTGRQVADPFEPRADQFALRGDGNIGRLGLDGPRISFVASDQHAVGAAQPDRRFERIEHLGENSRLAFGRRHAGRLAQALLLALIDVMHPQHRGERAARRRRTAGDLAGAAIDAQRQRKADALLAQPLDSLRQPFAVSLGDETQQRAIAERLVFEKAAKHVGQFGTGHPLAVVGPAGMGAGRDIERIVARGKRYAQIGGFAGKLAGALALATPDEPFGDHCAGASNEQRPGCGGPEPFTDIGHAGASALRGGRSGQQNAGSGQRSGTGCAAQDARRAGKGRGREI